MEYLSRHIKRDPVTGDVAIRTIFPTGDEPRVAMMEWLVASAIRGARNTPTSEVENWDDIFVPVPEASPADGS